MAHPKSTAISALLFGVAGSFTAGFVSATGSYETRALATAATSIGATPASSVRELMRAAMHEAELPTPPTAVRLASAKTSLTAAFAGSGVNAAAKALLNAADSTHDYGAQVVGASTITIAKGVTVDTIAHMTTVLGATFQAQYGVTVAADGTNGIVITSVAATFATGQAAAIIALAAAIVVDTVNQTGFSRKTVNTKFTALISAMSET